MLTPNETQMLMDRLVRGDPTASRDLYTAFHRTIYSLLKPRFAILPDETVQDAATDALLALINAPARYAPARGSLLNYLIHIGEHKLIDAIREWKRKNHLIFVGGNVELEQFEANQSRENATTPLQRGEEELPSEVVDLIYRILPMPRDRQLWELICAGRTAVAEYARILEITNLSVEHQQREVKRHRDRIQKRIRRHQDEFRRLFCVETN